MPGKDACLEFEDFSRFIAKPPKYGGLFSDLKRRRPGRKGSILVILPAYGEAEAAIARHLRALSRQTCRDFDVLLVLGPMDKAVKKCPAGISLLQLHRKFDYGFAGAVYAGQRFAVENGYEYAVWADIDRLPEGNGYLAAMQKIAKRENADAVLGRYVVRPEKKSDALPERRAEQTSLYSLVSARVFKKLGYTFLPIFMGADDVEYMLRLRTFSGESGVKVVETCLQNAATYRSVFYHDLVTGAKPRFFARFLSDLSLAKHFIGEARAREKKYAIYPYLYVGLFKAIFPSEGARVEERASGGGMDKMLLDGGVVEKYFSRETRRLPADGGQEYDFIFTGRKAQRGLAGKIARPWEGGLGSMARMALFFTASGLAGEKKIGVDLKLGMTGNMFQAFPIFLILNNVDFVDFEGGRVFGLSRKAKRSVPAAFWGMALGAAFCMARDILCKRLLGIGPSYRKNILGYGRFE